MNHVYRVVFNRALGVYQCVSEIAKSRGKSSGKSATSRSSNHLSTTFKLTALSVGLGLSGIGQAEVLDDGGSYTWSGNVYYGIDDTITNNTTFQADNIYLSNKTPASKLDITNSGKVNAKLTILTNDAVTTIDAGQLNSDTLSIGYEGTGSINANNGAVINAAQGINIGDGNSKKGNGALNISGANSKINSSIFGVGANGNGQFSASDSANVNVESMVLGRSDASNQGKVTVSDKGTDVTINNVLIVGEYGTGILDIKDGAKLNTKAISVGNFAESKDSTIDVSGQGSAINNDGLLLVGDLGEGTLTVSDGATVNSKADIVFGRVKGSQGSGVITGENSTISSNGDILVGVSGTGSLTASNASKIITSEEIYVGRDEGSNGTLLVQGERSSIEAATLTSGGNGTGSTTISNKATATINGVTRISGYGNFTSEQAKGSLTIDNATFNSPSVVVASGGEGTLNIINKGILNTQNIFSSFDTNAIVNIDNGEINVLAPTDSAFPSTLFNSFDAADTINIDQGGATIRNEARVDIMPLAVITGSGNFSKTGAGSLFITSTSKKWQGATNIEQGVLHIDGNYIMRDGEVLGIGLNSLTDYGQLEVNGTADITKGTLNVKASDAVNALTGSNEWKNVVTATTRTGEFNSVTDNNLLVDFKADYSDANAVHLRMISQAEADAKAEAERLAAEKAAAEKAAAEKAAADKAAADKAAAEKAAADKAAAEKAAADKAAAEKAAAEKAAAEKAAADKAAADKAAADKAAAEKAAADKAAAEKAAAEKAAADKAAADKAAADKAAAEKAAADKAAAEKAAADKAAADKAAADKAAADKAAADKAAADKAAADKAAADKAAADKAAADKAAADKAAADKAAADKAAADKAAADKAAADKAAADKAAAEKAAADKAAAEKLKAEQEKANNQKSKAFTQAVNSINNPSALGLATVLDQAIDDLLDTTTSANPLAKQLISDMDGLDQAQVAAATAQLQPLFMGGANRLVTDTNYAVGRAIEEHSQTTPERNLWAKAIGSDMTHDADGYVTGYNSENYGAIVGLDVPVNPNLNLGVAVSYIDSDADTDGHALTHEIDAKNWQILGYGNYAVSDATSVNFHAGAGQSQIKGERHIAGLSPAIAKSDYDVDTLQAGFGVAHRIGSTERNLSPFASMNYARAKSDSYRETGAGVYNLAVDSNTYDSLRWTAGVRFNQALTPTVALTGQLAGAVENGDQYSDITASFAEVNSGKFTTRGQESKDAIGIAGIGLAFNPTANTTISANYRGEWRSNYDDHGAAIVFETKF
ncbi:autotransporter domain-containing protein [Psychrobacter raelei]|uniref:autotransporter outer membrane beta-barrel domain-containing protein n=1 Tax=Psychrobacter raelei TaxID=2565531 RepID=UPI003F634FA4